MEALSDECDGGVEATCHLFYKLLFNGFRGDRNFAEFKGAVATRTGLTAEIAFRDSTADLPAGVVEWVVSSKYHLFRFSPKLLEHPYGDVILRNFANELPLVLGYSQRTGCTSGATVLNLEDFASMEGLTFSDNRPEFDLIPDPAFVGSDAYRGLCKGIAAAALPWPARHPVVFWRGSTTGWFSSAGAPIRSWSELPRIELCRLAQQHASASMFDVGIVNVVQLTAKDGIKVLEEGLMRPFVAPEMLAQYQAHIDIDGNTNAWMSLFAKLASGSPVLKVRSPKGFRQWYYDELKPWENYIPVDSSLADLFDRVTWIFEHPGQAKQIGERGRELALSMNLASELTRAVPVMSESLIRGRFRQTK